MRSNDRRALGTPPPADAEICVALTPREVGGHEVALLGWLSDAVRLTALRPAIMAPTAPLYDACVDRGLARYVWGTPGVGFDRRGLLQQLGLWPTARPLLLAPGSMHADAWLLVAAALRRGRLWAYLPAAHTARAMGHRAAWMRDRLIAPWLRCVDGWITIDERQRQVLRRAWSLRAPVHLLPNVPRVGRPPMRNAAVDKRLRVAYVGRFDVHTKGLDWLAAMLRSDPAWAARCHWRFQGRGGGEALLRDLAATLGPQGASVHAHAPIALALADSDVLLLCSRFEGVPLVALEATALGWPVVSARGLGLDTLLPAQSLFDFGDAGSLARALDALATPSARLKAAHHAQRCLAAREAELPYEQALHEVVAALRRCTATPC